MNKYYDMTIAGLEREIPLYQVEEDLRVGAFVMFADVELTKACAVALLRQAPLFDVLLTEETQGIPLAYEMVRNLTDATYVVARKAPKAYMDDAVGVRVQSKDGESIRHLYVDKSAVDLIKNKRVLLVDDIVSSGNTMQSLEHLVFALGGYVVGKMAVLAEGRGAEIEDLIYLERLPLFHNDGTVVDESTESEEA